MQSRQDELRIVRLGAGPGAVTITGNLKFDLPAPDFDEAEIARFRKLLNLRENIPVWVAGSTRQGEEEVVLDVFRQIIAAGNELVLILVPRYPKRAKSIAEMIEKNELAYELRSNIEQRKKPLSSGEILIGDSLGEMLKFYACADVVFVGGSLVPIGGHNILEATLLKKPVLFGPYMQNFKTISKLLIEAGGGCQVHAGELAEKLVFLLNNSGQRREMGEKGYNLFDEHSGATDRTVDEVRKIMGAE